MHDFVEIAVRQLWLQRRVLFEQSAMLTLLSLTSHARSLQRSKMFILI